MANITIKQIEDAMIAAVGTKCKKGVAVSGYVRTVDTYGGQLDEGLEALTARFPFVLFEMIRAEIETLAAKGASRLITKWKLSWHVYAGAQNLRGEKEARRSTGGVYDIIDDVTDALDGIVMVAGTEAVDVLGWDVIDNLPAGEGLNSASVYYGRLEVRTKHRTEAS